MIMRFYIAACAACKAVIPFKEEEARDAWADEHSQVDDPFTGRRHNVLRITQDVDTDLGQNVLDSMKEGDT